MKIKGHLYITDPVWYLKGYDASFTIMNHQNHIPDEWVYCGEIEVDADIEIEDIHQAAISQLDEKEEATRKKYEGELYLIKQAKQELMALEHKDGS